MAFLRQLVVTLAVLVLAGGVWLHFSATPGRYLLAEERSLPASVKSLVSAISPADDPAKVGATPSGDVRRQTALPLVVTDPVTPAVTRDRLRAIGTGEAIRSVAVRPDANGIISEIGFRSGDAIEAGAILAVLQNDAEKVAVERARIALSAAEDQLARYRSLSANTSITSVQLDEVRRTRDSAALDLRSAEIALAKRNIVAPISGRVGILDLDIGALVDGTTLIATVDDRSRIKIVFNAPEGFASGLRAEQPISAQPTTRSGETYEGRISALDSRLDEASRTLRTEAIIENVGDRLRPGMSFAVDVAFEGNSFLSVDPLAVQWERAGPFVWTVADETSRKAPIRIVERNVDRVLVASDVLKNGDAVIVEGIQQLRDGGKVRVRAPIEVPPAPVTPDALSQPVASETLPARRAAAEIGAVGRAAP